MRELIGVAGLVVVCSVSVLAACRGEGRDPSATEPTSIMLTAEDDAGEDDKRKDGKR